MKKKELIEEIDNKMSNLLSSFKIDIKNNDEDKETFGKFSDIFFDLCSDTIPRTNPNRLLVYSSSQWCVQHCQFPFDDVPSVKILHPSGLSPP